MFRKAHLLIPALVFISFSIGECEVTLDGSLGTSGNVQGPNYSIEAAMGKQMGSSLFHSFEKFDINTGENATFKGPADIERIISRVTGGNQSKIDGAIRSEIQGADFYFINPFGMIFGPNASLDITGSFFATSADYVKLGENGRFDARNPEKTVLTADAPEAFGFLGQKPGDIVVESNPGLKVSDDKGLMLAGGDVKINGGILSTYTGNLNVISVASEGEVDTEGGSENFIKFGKVEVSNNGCLTSGGGGKLICKADALNMSEYSTISTGGMERGTIGLDIGSLNLSKSWINSYGYQDMRSAPSIKINASRDILLTGAIDMQYAMNCISTAIYSDGAIPGSIQISSPLLIMKNARITAEAQNAGNSGDMFLDIGELRMANYSSIDNSIFNGQGNTGIIHLNSSLIDLADNSFIGCYFNNSKGFRNGMTINSAAITISNNSWIGDMSYNNSSGSAEDLIINSPKIDVSAWSWIGSYQYNSSTDGAALHINASEINIHDAGSLYCYSYHSSGSSGDVIIDTKNLSVKNGGWITATKEDGSGHAGNVTINASDYVLLIDKQQVSGASIFSRAKYSALADAGSININTDNLIMKSGAQLSCNNIDGGKSGNINISAQNIFLDTGVIEATATSAGGGNIYLNCRDFFHLENSLINAEVLGGAGDGGNIELFNPSISLLRSSRIIARAVGGNGGNISISSDYFLKDGFSNLDASSKFGFNGSVDIYTPDVDINSGLIRLAEEYQDPASFIKDPCIERMEGRSSSLTSGAGLARRRNPFSYFESSCEAQ